MTNELTADPNHRPTYLQQTRHSSSNHPRPEGPSTGHGKYTTITAIFTAITFVLCIVVMSIAAIWALIIFNLYGQPTFTQLLGPLGLLGLGLVSLFATAMGGVLVEISRKLTQ